MKSVIIKDKTGIKLIHIKTVKNGYDIQILKELNYDVFIIDENNKRIKLT